MRLIFRMVYVTIAALLLTIGANDTAFATSSIIPPPDDVITSPARPASARELPPSRVQLSADITYGVAARSAVASFRASRQFGFMKSFASPQSVVHAGEGYYLLGTSTTTFGAYANETVYPMQREPGSPDSSGFLYAPTMFGPGADCIEAVTVVQNQAPQVWAWDWCAANPNPYAVIDVDAKFKKNYLRKMPDKLTEYAVETILAADGVTWDMALYNYTLKKWEIIYQTSGKRNANYGLGEEGWNFFGRIRTSRKISLTFAIRSPGRSPQITYRLPSTTKRSRASPLPTRSRSNSPTSIARISTSRRRRRTSG